MHIAQCRFPRERQGESENSTKLNLSDCLAIFLMGNATSTIIVDVCWLYLLMVGADKNKSRLCSLSLFHKMSNPQCARRYWTNIFGGKKVFVPQLQQQQCVFYEVWTHLWCNIRLNSQYDGVSLCVWVCECIVAVGIANGKMWRRRRK